MSSLDLELKSLVDQGEVITSAQLTGRVVDRYGVNADAARKLVSRRYNKDGLWRSEHLKLERNERLFSRSEFVATSDFTRVVALTLEKTSRASISRVLMKLFESKLVRYEEVQKLLAGPIKGVHPQKQLKILRELGVAVEDGSGSTPEYAYLPDLMSSEDELESIVAGSEERCNSHSLLAKLLIEHYKNQNFISWNGGSYPSPPSMYVDCSGYPFSAVGFSYLRPLLRFENGAPKSCAVVLDVYPGKCCFYELESFRERALRAGRFGKKVLPVVPIIAATTWDEDAWKASKGYGFITINLNKLFGKEALEAIEVVSQIWARTDAQGNFQVLIELLEELKTNPIVKDLRSIGFEALAGLFLSSEGWEAVSLGSKVPFNGTKRDVDVLGTRKDDAYLIECKALLSTKSLPLNDISKFFGETVPAYLSWRKNRQLKTKTVHASLWTTGAFDDECQKCLDSCRSSWSPKIEVKATIWGTETIRTSLGSNLHGRCSDLLRVIGGQVKK